MARTDLVLSSNPVCLDSLKPGEPHYGGTRHDAIGNYLVLASPYSGPDNVLFCSDLVKERCKLGEQ